MALYLLLESAVSEDLNVEASSGSLRRGVAVSHT